MRGAGEVVAVVGLGYVGLPVALAFARKSRTIGFDISAPRVAALKAGRDATGEVDAATLKTTRLELTSEPAALAEATFYVVAVPTPIDDSNRPDLEPLRRVSELVGAYVRPGDVVVYESTVYPGVTEEFCGPILEKASGLKSGVDFFLGYSPERINPGDKLHTFERITKIVSGQDAATLERVAAAYGSVVEAGVFRAKSIQVAETAKVIENTQRDLNIAFVNELAMILARMGIRTKDVLDAAATKWNFLRFEPGLVGGHCIGVDPYYLTAKAEELGYQPEVILAGRRTNNGIGAFIAQRTVKLLAQSGLGTRGARVGVLGLTFKENVPDLRNSRVRDILRELGDFGIVPLVHCPLCDPEEALAHMEVELSPWEALRELDALIYAVPHRAFTERSAAELVSGVRDGGVVIDVKSRLEPTELGRGLRYWSL